MQRSLGKEPMRILGIGGSTRQGSQSLLALKAALAIAEEENVTTVLADVRELDLPLYNTDLSLEDYPASLSWLLNEARKADAYLLCSPTYHGTISGAVKNVLDALNFLGKETPPYFGGKTVGLMAVGGGAFNVINSLHHAAHAMNGVVIPTILALPHSPVEETTGLLRDPKTHHRLVQMIRQLTDLTQRLRVPV